MRLLVKIWLCAGCLLGIAEWSQARPTEPDTLMRALREAASPTNALIREAYANPATRPDAFGHSLSELSIGYRLQTEEQPTVRQKGDRTDFGYFATEGYRHLSEKSTLWGDAGYRIGKRRNVVWMPERPKGNHRSYQQIQCGFYRLHLKREWITR